MLSSLDSLLPEIVIPESYVIIQSFKSKSITRDKEILHFSAKNIVSTLFIHWNNIGNQRNGKGNAENHRWANDFQFEKSRGGIEMFDGVMLLWFLLTALSLLFVVVDIRATPESPVLKWGFVLLTAYTGPLGAFLYVLGCREPLPGLHERYVAIRWRQVLGSTMHCVAGDGVGILAGAVIANLFHFPKIADIALEYALGFGFGWSVFQALFMRAMAGGLYMRALSRTFFPELLSMNCLMAGMVPVMTLAMKSAPASRNPSEPAFWFIMSMALLVGFITAYPMNWWLVSRHMKHGMMTVRHENMHDNHMHSERTDSVQRNGKRPMGGDVKSVSNSILTWMTILSFLVFGLGLSIAIIFGGL